MRLETDDVKRQCSPLTLFKIKEQLPALKNLTDRMFGFKHDLLLMSDGLVRIMSDDVESLILLEHEIKYDFGKFEAEGLRFNTRLNSPVLVVRYWLISNLYNTLL
jgi:hypothetical protein